jgi:ketosteroid isomerase-like protein
MYSGMGASAQGMFDSQSQVCGKHLQQRSPEQVLEAHLAAFRSGNAELIACDYHKDAVFMMPGTVVRGRDDIQATFLGFFQAAGPINSLTATSITPEKNAIFMTYKFDSAHIVINDGVDTFVISHGLIVLQTAYLGGFVTR